MFKSDACITIMFTFKGVLLEKSLANVRSITFALKLHVIALKNMVRMSQCYNVTEEKVA